jgi:hypothetical protein
LHKAWSISPAARAGSDRKEKQIESDIETDAGCEKLKGGFRHNHVRFPIRNVPNNIKRHTRRRFLWSGLAESFWLGMAPATRADSLARVRETWQKFGQGF